MRVSILTLNKYYREASLGYGYLKLFSEYPNWSCDLHSKGNFLRNDLLYNISKNGIIRWYFSNLIKFDIDYDYGIIEILKKNPQYITFYDLKKIIQMGNIFNIKNKYIDSLDILNFNYKFEYIFKIFPSINIKNSKIRDKYLVSPFGLFTCDKIGCSNLTDYIEDVYTEYRKYINFFKGETLYNLFLEKYPHILDWGIIYHKFKIILEKITRVKHPDIYKVDIFVDKIQTYIFSLVAYHCKNIMDNNDSIITLIGEDQFFNEKLMKYYNDSDLKSFCFDNLFV